MAQYSAPNFDVNLDPEGLVIDLDSLYAALARLKDSRHARGLRYNLVNILVCIVLAKLAGEDYLAGIAEWVALRKKPLSDMLHWVKPRAAHRSTYSRILGRVIDITEFERVVHDFFANPANAGESILINLDGKTLRGTIPAGKTRGVHLLAAYLPGEGWVLAQIEVGTKENEIPASARMLKCLDLQGKIITGDALLAQRELSRQIVEAEGNYVWTLKENHPQLYEDLETLFAGETPVKGFSPATQDFRPAETIEKAHGRIERRTLTASTELKGYGNWPYAEQVFKLERHFERVADGRVMHEVVYGVTSLTAQEADAARLLEIVRGHWSIENRLHYRRDQTMREDWYHVRMGTAPQAMAVINNLVLGLLDQQDFRSVPEARRHYAANLDQALDLIIQSPC
jgi:predicted transposase YbfD/YdcC